MVLAQHSFETMVPDVAPENSKGASSTIAFASGQWKSDMAEEENVIAEETGSNSILWPLRFPLVSKSALLCASPSYILTSESSKRKNNLVLIDENQRKFVVRSPIKSEIRQTLWVGETGKFLLLTEQMIWSFDPTTTEIKAVPEIKPPKEKPFKTFALLNLSILIVAYDEWHPKLLDQWRFDADSKLWKQIDSVPVNTHEDEFVGHLTADQCDNESGYLIVSICNDVSNEWRIAFMDLKTFCLTKAIRVPSFDITEDLKILPIHNNESHVSWLAYFANRDLVICITEGWETMVYQYRSQVQDVVLFKRKYLSFRTNTQLTIQLIT